MAKPKVAAKKPKMASPPMMGPMGSMMGGATPMDKMAPSWGMPKYTGPKKRVAKKKGK